jgi:outer membrane cobalamin receptor
VGSLRHQRDRIGQENTPGFQETAIGQTTWKAGVNLLLPLGGRAYMSLGTSFSTPSLYALGANQAAGRPAPGNEQSRSLLAGIGWQAGGWSLRAEANRIAYDALLQFVPTGMFAGYYENRTDVRIQGIEANAAWQAPTWGLEGFLRSQEGRDLTLPEATQRTVFQNRPFFSAGLGAHAALGDFRLFGRAAFLGHRYVYSDDHGGVVPERTHFVDLTVRAEYRVTESLDLLLRADHLLQAPLVRADWELGQDLGRNNVAVLPGYPAPTRTLSLEARYRF